MKYFQTQFDPHNAPQDLEVKFYWGNNFGIQTNASDGQTLIWCVLGKILND